MSFSVSDHYQTGSRPGTWIAAIALAALFSIFAGTMTWMTGYNLAINYTTIEALQRGGITHIAFLINSMPTDPTAQPTPPTSSKDERDKAEDIDDDWSVLGIVRRGGGRSFVIMHTKPFQHPWSTSLMRGWKDTMGESVLDWFSPLKNSPCTQKTRRGEFRWGEVVYDMARKYEKEHPGARLALSE